ncbi:MAG: hypothetical protein K2Q12_11450 [Rickettsiales bacterium]|nr:hypothetical protein [Rickettsiales bacterium]
MTIPPENSALDVSPEIKAAMAKANLYPTHDDLERQFYKDLPFLERFLVFKDAVSGFQEPGPDARKFLKPGDMARMENEEWMLTANHDFMAQSLMLFPDARWIDNERGASNYPYPYNPRLDLLRGYFYFAIAQNDQPLVQRLLDEARGADHSAKADADGNVPQNFSGIPVLFGSIKPYSGFEEALLGNGNAIRHAYSSGHRALGDYLIERELALPKNIDNPNALRQLLFWCDKGDEEEFSSFGSHCKTSLSMRANLDLMRRVYTLPNGEFDERNYYERLENILTDNLRTKPENHPQPYQNLRSAAKTKDDEDALFDAWMDVARSVDEYRNLTGRDAHSYRAFRNESMNYSVILGAAIVNGRLHVAETILGILRPLLGQEELSAFIKESINQRTLPVTELLQGSAEQREKILAPLRKYLSEEEVSHYIYHTLFISKMRNGYDHVKTNFESNIDLLHEEEGQNPQHVIDFLLQHCSVERLMGALVGGDPLQMDAREELHENDKFLGYVNYAKPEFLQATLNSVMAIANQYQSYLEMTPQQYRERFVFNTLNTCYHDYKDKNLTPTFLWCLDQLDTLPKSKADAFLHHIVACHDIFLFYYILGQGEFVLAERLLQRMEAMENFTALEERILEREFKEMQPEKSVLPPPFSGRRLREELGLSLRHVIFSEFHQHWNEYQHQPRSRESTQGFLKCLNLMKRFKITEAHEEKIRAALGGEGYKLDYLGGALVTAAKYKSVMYAIDPNLRWMIERYAMSNDEIDAHYKTDILWPDAPHAELLRYHPMNPQQVELYERLLPLMNYVKGNEHNGVPEIHAYKLACMFDNFAQAAKFIAHHAQADTRSPIHDLLLFELPKLMPFETTWQRDLWAQRMVRYGMGVSLLVQRAVEIEQLMRAEIHSVHPDLSEKQQTIKLRNRLKNATASELKSYAKQVIYDAKATFVPDPEVREYLIRVGVDQMGYERTAEIIAATMDDLKNKKLHDKTPDISIHGDGLLDEKGQACKGFAMSKVKTVGETDPVTLQRNIARCLWVGFEVNCCNHIDGETRNLALAQATSPTTSLYVIKKPGAKNTDDKVVAKLSGWLNKAGDVFVFNAWERLSGDHDRLCVPFLDEAAMQIMRSYPEIREVRIGQSRANGSYPRAATIELPANSLAVANESSSAQHVIMDRAQFQRRSRGGATGFSGRFPKRDPLALTAARQIGS